MRGLLTVPAPAQAPTRADYPAPQPAVARPASSSGGFDPGRSWRLHPQVAVRPEPFGALLYHFGTRKLSFLKNRTILAVVQSLADHPDVRTACRAAGVEDADQRLYLHALGLLAGSNMLVPTGPKEQP
ncbi:MAG: mycofactocin biosynthesis chaperone MftB [Mycobacterium sp.]